MARARHIAVHASPSPGERVGPSTAVKLPRRMEMKAGVSAHFDCTTEFVQGAESGVLGLGGGIRFQW